MKETWFCRLTLFNRIFIMIEIAKTKEHVMFSIVSLKPTKKFGSYRIRTSDAILKFGMLPNELSGLLERCVFHHLLCR